MNETPNENENKKAALRELIKKLHEGMPLEEAKKEFKELFKDTTTPVISKIEDELVKEGLSREEILKLCDVHIAVSQEQRNKTGLLVPLGHPLHILMEEHKILLQFADELNTVAKEISASKDFETVSEQLKKLTNISEHFKAAEKHYLREENVLFPYIEKHGLTEPPAVMWTEHNKIREIKKTLSKIVEIVEKVDFQEFARQLNITATTLANRLSKHFYKENKILFPSALQLINENEWDEIRQQFDEIGYCCFTPEAAIKAVREVEKPTPKPKVVEGMINLETGNLSKEDIEAIFNNLPVDITFVDAQDTVRYFSQTKDRIFVRTKAVIGRKVQNCHPQKSLHVVDQILNDFREGKRDNASFWISLEGRLIYIRYFPVRNKDGDYLGCIEVTQDITDIKKIEGEKRLLD